MKFSENADFSINYLSEVKKSFIYFLIFNGEVVYVGKTTQGLCRPFSHKDKVFDTVSILYCNNEDLENTECKFILKYLPKYNSTITGSVTIGTAKLILRKSLNTNQLFTKDIKNAISNLGIVTTAFKSLVYISSEDLQKVLKHLEGNDGTSF